MFQLWKLVLLCGFLIGTSASVSASDQDVVSELKSVLQKELESDDSASKSILDQVKVDFDSLQKPACLADAPENMLDEKMFKNFHVAYKCFWLRIRKIHVVSIIVTATFDGKGIILRIPIIIKVTVTLPLSGTVIDLTLKLVLETSVTIETVVVIGGFTHKPATILLPSLYRPFGPFEKINNTAITLVEEVETFIVPDMVFPRIQSIISSLDVSFIKEVIAAVQKNSKQK